MKRMSGRQVKVFSAEGGFRVVRSESRDRAERLVMQEVLRPEFSQVTGELLGYRMVGVEMRPVDSNVRSMRSSVAISPSEMELNCERSKTEGSSELRRRKLLACGFPAEDRVERVRAKVRVYAMVGPGIGDILRVWPKR